MVHVFQTSYEVCTNQLMEYRLGMTNYPLVLKHGNGKWTPYCISFCPINTSSYRGLSIAMFDYQRVNDSYCSMSATVMS